MLVTRAQRKQYFVALVENRCRDGVLELSSDFQVRGSSVTDGHIHAGALSSRLRVWDG